MALQLSDETKVELSPRKFALNDTTKVVTFINGEPPAVSGKGRRANPVITEIYSNLITNRGTWAHVNIPITSKKQKTSIIASLYSRTMKDNLSLSTRSLFNERTKLYDLWVMVS
jgi:hypothetical protein